MCESERSERERERERKRERERESMRVHTCALVKTCTQVDAYGLWRTRTNQGNGLARHVAGVRHHARHCSAAQLAAQGSNHVGLIRGYAQHLHRNAARTVTSEFIAQ